MTLSGISLMAIALGVLLLLFGVFLMLKRLKTAGIIVGAFGLAVIVIPTLAYLYIATVMR